MPPPSPMPSILPSPQLEGWQGWNEGREAVTRQTYRVFNETRVARGIKKGRALLRIVGRALLRIVVRNSVSTVCGVDTKLRYKPRTPRPFLLHSTKSHYTYDLWPSPYSLSSRNKLNFQPSPFYCTSIHIHPRPPARRNLIKPRNGGKSMKHTLKDVVHNGCRAHLTILILST